MWKNAMRCQVDKLGQAVIVFVLVLCAVMSFGCSAPGDANIPITGDAPRVELTCRASRATIVMQLRNGDEVRLPCGVADTAILEAVPEETLPVVLAKDYRFVSCLAINVLKGNALVGNWGLEKRATISFSVPAASANRALTIFYWDLRLRGGIGDWSAVATTVARGRAETAVDYPGTFILAAR
jgi:hypothetical protein